MSSIETIGGHCGPVPQTRDDTLKTIVRKLGLWSRNYRTRKQLADLTDAELKDLGLSREAARVEAIRPFWEAGNRNTGAS